MVRTTITGIKGTTRIIRSQIPRYRKNLAQLPPLTKLLTSQEKPPSLEVLRQQKLSIYKSFIPDNQKVPLLEAIFNPSNDLVTLLQIIDANLETMTSFYVGVSFEALYDAMQENPDKIATVLVSPEFKRLCVRALYKARHFESDETLKVLKCVSTMGLPEDTLIVQATLQMTRNLINDYNADELNTLMKALDRLKLKSNHDGKSLALALKKAIPLAKERLFDMKHLANPEDQQRLE